LADRNWPSTENCNFNQSPSYNMMRQWRRQWRVHLRRDEPTWCFGW